ncbi:transmembrane channel-like protein [Cardiocondyla obscurior]|uniref:transmembrane channel-like protein n=1 Tax=Cardiocondyla obscurior TaxID=286306 RepID=UPI0039655E76
MQADSTRSMGQMRIPGILRLGKTTRSSEFTATQTLAAMQVGPSSSPSQSHPGRQSVTFGIVEFQQYEDLAENQKSWSNRRRFRDTQQVSIPATFKRASTSEISQNLAPMEKSTADGEEIDSEEDYSASVSAIMQQRNPTRRHSRRKRRPSFSFGDNVDGVARRRSSVYTTSSGDTVISMDESGHQEQICENVKLHKEVLSGIKQQPWTLRRKIKLVRQAKAYIRRHEGALQERLAQSRSTKDVIARVSLIITKKWQYFRRELVNLQTWLIPWEVRIMEIESHFGSAVASYFTFLRWLFWINLVIAATLAVLVVIPKILFINATLHGGKELNDDSGKTSLQSLLKFMKFEGEIKNSPFFYGWYTNQKSSYSYKLSIAYFVTNLAVYTYSFVAILRKMAENSRLSKLTEKEEEYIFSWKLFTGWDFMIGNPETAHNRTASTMRGFKEALLEEAEKQKDERNWRIISIRIFVNVVVLSLLGLSAYTVIMLVELSTKNIEMEESWWRQNSITIVMSLITYLFPILFEILGFFESYHPRKQLRIQLARIMILNLLNLYALVIPQFREMLRCSPDSTKPRNNCKDKRVPCTNELPRMQQIVALASLNLVLMNNTHSYVKRELPEPMQQSAVQGFFLNPLWDNSSELNDSDLDIGNYEYDTSNMDDGDPLFSTTPNYENVTESMNNEIQNDANSTVTTSFMTDSMTTKLFDIISISSPSKTTAPTTIQSNIINDECLQPCDSNTCDPKHYKKACKELCWETRFGQELAKLTVMDLILTILATLSMDFFRAVFVRFMNNCWCWDLEKQFPQYGDFKIAENILHLVNNQGMIWMGMFFSPGLTVLNLFKLGILMYLRSWAVLTCNVPHEVVFRASRSNNFYFALLLTMLFFCVLPVGYAIVWIKPSCQCGPFSECSKIYELTTRSLICSLPKWMQGFLKSFASSSTVIPLIVLMTLIIYYMASLARSLREANNDLKIQLRHERTEERRKLFKIAEKRHTVAETPLSRWKKILPALPQAKISQNSEIAKRDDIQVQITIEKVNDKTENKQLTNYTDDSSSQKQVLSDYSNNQRTEEQNSSVLNDASSNKRPISVVGCSWDSPTSRQSVIVPEIQVNNEDNILSDIHGIVELPDDKD